MSVGLIIGSGGDRVLGAALIFYPDGEQLVLVTPACCLLHGFVQVEDPFALPLLPTVPDCDDAATSASSRSFRAS